jgi:hypothetical protein
MNIRVLGFEFSLNRGVAVNDLVAALKTESGTRFRYQSLDRVVTVAEQGDHLIGSIWTDKGQKKFTEIDQTSNEMRTRGCDPGKSLSGFNFFAISLKKKRGLSTHYADSGGQSLVCGLLLRAADEALRANREKAVTALGANATTEQKKKTRERFTGEGLSWAPLLNRAQIEAVLNGFKKIKNFTVRLKAVAADPAMIASPIIATEDRKFGFTRDAGLAAKAKHILDIARNRPEGTDAIFVEGVNGDGVDIRFDLGSIPDWFGAVKYEEFLSKPNLFATNLTDAALVKHLLGVMRKRSELF